MSIHPYICECTRINCTEKLYLSEPEWRWLAAKGSVVSLACAKRDGKKLLRESFTGGAVAVRGRRDRLGTRSRVDRPTAIY